MKPQWIGHHDCDNPAHVPIEVDEAGAQRLLGARWVDTWRAAWKESQRAAFEAMIEEMIAVGKPGQVSILFVPEPAPRDNGDHHYDVLLMSPTALTGANLEEARAAVKAADDANAEAERQRRQLEIRMGLRPATDN